MTSFQETMGHMNVLQETLQPENDEGSVSEETEEEIVAEDDNDDLLDEQTKGLQIVEEEREEIVDEGMNGADNERTKEITSVKTEEKAVPGDVEDKSEKTNYEEIH